MRAIMYMHFINSFIYLSIVSPLSDKGRGESSPKISAASRESTLDGNSTSQLNEQILERKKGKHLLSEVSGYTDKRRLGHSLAMYLPNGGDLFHLKESLRFRFELTDNGIGNGRVFCGSMLCLPSSPRAKRERRRGR